MAKPFSLTAPVPTEDDLHVSVRSALSIAIAPPGKTSRCGVLWYSVEARNAGGRMIRTKSGAMIPLEAVNRKRRGCVAGVPDVHLMYVGRLYLIELKRERRGSTSADQKELHSEYACAGIPVRIARTLSDVLYCLAEWEIPLTHRLAV